MWRIVDTDLDDDATPSDVDTSEVFIDLDAVGDDHGDRSDSDEHPGTDGRGTDELGEPTDGDDPEAPRGRGLWLVVGGVLLILGLGAAAAGVYATVIDDSSNERRVGRLIGTETEGTEKSDKASASEPAASTDGDPDGAAASTGEDATATTAAPAASTVERWPVTVQGRPPAFGADGDPPPADAGDLADGYYLWQDFAGWHLWLVGGQGADGEVEIRSDDVIASAVATGGQPAIDKDRNRLVVRRGDAGENVVGVDFNPGFYGRTMVVTTTGDLPLHLGTQAIEATEYLGLALSTTN